MILHGVMQLRPPPRMKPKKSPHPRVFSGPPDQHGQYRNIDSGIRA
jgi:hypothetical protein